MHIFYSTLLYAYDIIYDYKSAHNRTQKTHSCEVERSLLYRTASITVVLPTYSFISSVCLSLAFYSSYLVYRFYPPGTCVEPFDMPFTFCFAPFYFRYPFNTCTGIQKWIHTQLCANCCEILIQIKTSTLQGH